MLAYLFVYTSVISTHHFILYFVLQMGLPQIEFPPLEIRDKSDSSLNPSDLVTYYWILSKGLVNE